jgi:hypothetical protein
MSGKWSAGPPHKEKAPPFRLPLRPINYIMALVLGTVPDGLTEAFGVKSGGRRHRHPQPRRLGDNKRPQIERFFFKSQKAPNLTCDAPLVFFGINPT